MNNLLTVAFRQQAIYVPQQYENKNVTALSGPTAALVANLSKLGFSVSEPLLHALNQAPPAYLVEVLEMAKHVTGVNKNWTPLVKGWDTPTGESLSDHIITFFVNLFQTKGSRLACGHIIPQGTFPLERYNGCPFCGTPFEFGKIEHYKQNPNEKMLGLWTEKTAADFLLSLLTSRTALDATQTDSLKLLMQELPVPEVNIEMKETVMTVVDVYVTQDTPEKAQRLFSTPADIMRYLWYKHTGFLQLIEPKVVVQRNNKNNRYFNIAARKSAKAELEAKNKLKLKYTRKQCLVVATWINNLDMEAEKMCEIMHPKRDMWVRFIRALRLTEYSKREGFEKLNTLLDKFYREDYKVWSGQLSHFRLRHDAANTFKLLKQRPGLFARSLFANMLWFGVEETMAAFAEVADQVPARLIFTLNMYAENYFSGESRTIKPLGGNAKNIPANRLLKLYDNDQLKEMQNAIANLTLDVMRKRFKAAENKNSTMYIDHGLFNIPLSIGDRSTTVHDVSSALQGTRFKVEGESVRLFMQWGTGLKAQHLDMDLSCMIIHQQSSERCSFSQLVATGCKHSGDIQSIPDKIGTAEYIEINLSQLREAKAEYVMFTCNAYTYGALSPNMVVGWMNSEYPMHISNTTGVAYDPSCVQHQVRIVNSLDKGLLFGVLDVKAGEITWLEMPFGGQVIQLMNIKGVHALLKKLQGKLTVGNLLKLKAEAQKLKLVKTPEADEVYTMDWAKNTAEVTKLLID